jgi:hypothetical protein
VRVVLHPDARAEVRVAAIWYDEQRDGLGVEFLAAVAELLSTVGDRPLSYPLWPGTPVGDPTIRRASMSRFPYFAACEAHADHVLVLAFAHAKRRPLYWLERATVR